MTNIMRERYQIMNMYGFSATHHNKQPASSPSPTGSEQDKMKPRELLSLVLVLLGLVSGAVLQASELCRIIIRSISSPACFNAVLQNRRLNSIYYHNYSQLITKPAVISILLQCCV